MAKRTKWRLVKTHRNYTVDEAARLLSKSKGTIRRWIKKGLPVIEGKPALIKGSHLIDFLKAKSKPLKKCDLDECYCFKCRSNQKVAFEEVEIIFDQSQIPNMQGLCSTCSTVMNKRISKARIPEIEAILLVSFKQVNAPISNRVQPRSNDHLLKES